MKILSKLYISILAVLFITSCQAGLEYEEVPENIYNDVNLTSALCNVKSRQLFENQIYATGWGKWVPDYISTVSIDNFPTEWTNNTSSSITLEGKTVAPGEKITLKKSLKEESLAEAPGGTLYVIQLYATSKATYSTTGKKYLFDQTKFTGDFTLVAPIDGRSTSIVLPVKQNEVIVEMLLSQEYNCKVYPQNGAPELGKPGDFTAPRQYLVVNESRRPDGQEAAKRLYEVRITFLP